MSIDQTSWRAPRRHALLIATDEYDDADWAQLRSPAADAAGLAAALGDPAIGDFSVSTLMNATSTQIRSELDGFLRDRTRDDFLLLYFSCHGYREAGEFYFAARDTIKQRLRATGVEGQYVHRLLNQSAADRVVVVLDCCYSGSFPRGAKGLTTDVTYLTEIVSGTGRAVITASGSIENAYEDTGVLISSHPVPSIFTEALIHGLRSGLADQDGDGHVAVTEWFEYATDRLLRRGAVQTPHMWNADVVGKLFVARNPFYRAPIATTSGTVLAAMTGGGMLGRLAGFAARLPGGKNLVESVSGLVDQVRGILHTARMPAAWWALVGSLRELSGGKDADGAVAQLMAALRRLEQDPVAVDTVSDVLTALEILMRDPGFANALGNLVRAVEIAVGTAPDLLRRIVTPELSRRVYGLAHEFATRFFIEPDERPSQDTVIPVQPAPRLKPESDTQQAAAELIERVHRLAHAVRGLAGYDALRQAIGEYIPTLVVPELSLTASAAEVERAADLILELTLRFRGFVHGTGAAAIRRQLIEGLDEISEGIRDARRTGTHADDLVKVLREDLGGLVDGLIEAITSPGLIVELVSATENLREESVTSADLAEIVQELVDDLAEFVEEIPGPDEDPW